MLNLQHKEIVKVLLIVAVSRHLVIILLPYLTRQVDNHRLTEKNHTVVLLWSFISSWMHSVDFDEKINCLVYSFTKYHV